MISKLLDPQSVALVGASPKPGTVGYVILENLVTRFRGAVYPVNPKYDEVELWGRKLKFYKSVSEIDATVDVVVVATPAPTVPSIVEEAGRRGIPAAVVISSGFAEAGNQELEQRLASAARQYGVRLLGPNCIGVYNAFSNFDTLFLPLDRAGRPPPGPLALISQSGAVAAAIMDWAARRGIGLGLVVNYGNKADVTEVELIEHFAADDRIRVITIYLEGFKYRGEAAKFLNAVRKTVPKKPVVVYKAGRGRAAQRAVRSHTAAMAGTYEMYKGLFSQAGALEASSVREMFDMAKALATQPIPRGPRALVVSDSGGMAIQAVDALEALGLEVPEVPESIARELKRELLPFAAVSNPIDVTGSATDQHYKVVLDALLPTAFFDMALVITLMQVPGLTKNLAEYIIDSRRYGKPIAVVNFGGSELVQRFEEVLEDSGIPVYPTPERAAKALWALYKYGEIRRRL
ncbi:acetate--CoA ligase family protein [Pyrobaculum neutrophilum]|uniref:CoA-binding domain protein n=1 Tax=Pyrobaculum neutrophilum (strain DSM 2338 / JCM 9278 / NBRC 100436 / V24Sta) TaxID=444157 RepID=B1YA08_PYRNV|nr:acetate--CoA ligase family protein [Pyrobaculum neutrophilum]ACB40558.1 CoA-binding domain protein [Pyrobaculum neutrophilum V24Sta]